MSSFSRLCGAGLTIAALSACSMGESQPTPTTFVETTTTLAPDEFDPLLERNFGDLLVGDAGVQIIFVPAEIPGDRSDWNEYLEANYQQLVNDDPEFASDVQENMSRITEGRFTPSSTKVTFAEAFDSGANCFDTDDGKLVVDLDKHVQPYRNLSALTITYFDQPACDDETAGFSLRGYSPTILQNGFAGFSSDSIHETAHSVGLGHARTVVCEDIVAIKDCDIPTPDDLNTLMSAHISFNLDNNDFTAPELNYLGLLKTEEVVENPKSGEYRISSTSGAFVEAHTLKLLVLDTDAGRIFISNESDSQGHTDQSCQETSQVVDDVRYRERGAFPINGVETNVSCGIINTREGVFSSLQVRLPDSDGLYQGFQLVARASRTPEDILDRMTSGEVSPETTVYQDTLVTITLVGIDLETATVRVENNNQ